MTKKQFGAMIKSLQQGGQFKFPSEEKLQASLGHALVYTRSSKQDPHKHRQKRPGRQHEAMWGGTMTHTLHGVRSCDLTVTLLRATHYVPFTAFQAFVEREFTKHDVQPKNNKWSFDE